VAIYRPWAARFLRQALDIFQSMPIQRSIISFSALLSSLEGASKWRKGQETFVQMISSCSLDPGMLENLPFANIKGKKQAQNMFFAS